jgi:hypothetical protein
MQLRGVLIQIYILDKFGGTLSSLKCTFDEMRDRTGGFSRAGMFYPNKYNIRIEYQQLLH